jgi:hypothetical protein
MVACNCINLAQWTAAMYDFRDVNPFVTDSGGLRIANHARTATTMTAEACLLV